ncbi:unnamed protein product [Closterium sp. NIES-64]|nr:unnamed protein product [Closterium sp. NIES-64]
MDPSARRDTELEGSAESALPEPVPAGLRPRVPAHPSAREPVRRFERVLTLPHRPAARPTSPEYSWAPARVASNRPDGQPRQERGRSPPRRVISGPLRVLVLLAAHLLEVGQASAHPERDPPRNALRGDLRRRGGGGHLGVAGSRVVASSPLRVRIRLVPEADGAGGMVVGVAARASGEPTHVHIEVTNGPPFAADPRQVAPLRAPTLRECQPAREVRAQFHTPHQVPGFFASRFPVGRTPGWLTAFPREAPTAPPPTHAGRDPMLTMCRILNVAEACEVVANLQLAVCAATRNFPSSYGSGSRGYCVSLAESLESPLAPVSEAPAGVAPLARTFPRHVGDLVEAARVGAPVGTLQSSAHLLLAMWACMRSMLEMEGAELYTM